MFSFRIIICADGTEVIDRQRKTFYNQLTPDQMKEYIELDFQLELMDRLEQMVKEEDYRGKLRNPIYRLACLCGMI